MIDSIAGKTISFYLNHPAIDKFSKLFYLKKNAVSDDIITFSLFDSLFTANKQTKPFYIFICNSIVNLSDGALPEGICSHCFMFIEKNPCDFIRLTNSNKYVFYSKKWIDLAAFDCYFTEVNLDSVFS